MCTEGSANLVDMRSMAPNGFMQLIARYTELFRPVSDVRGQLRVYLLRIMGTFGVVLVDGMRFVGFGGVVVLRHLLIPLTSNNR